MAQKMHVFRTPLLWCESALARLVPAGAAQAFAPVSVVVEAYQDQCLLSALQRYIDVCII